MTHLPMTPSLLTFALRWGLVALSGLLSSALLAQVPRQVVVEHFTNTRCSICAARNPDFYQNLRNHPQVLHMAVHPSSPYANCVLSQHNRPANDGRTRHYGIYGGTPRLVVQGNVVSGAADYGAASLFAPYLGQTTPFELIVSEIRYGTDSIAVDTWLHTRGAGTLAQARLYVAFLEDTVFYDAPNGESEHYAVLREALTDSSGALIELPAPGDSLRLRRSLIPRSEWELARMFALAILADPTTDTVLQAGQTTQVRTETSTNLAEAASSAFGFFPNPAQDRLTLRHPQAAIRLLDGQGRVIRAIPQPQHGQVLDLSLLPAGLYWLQHGTQGYGLMRR